ncbi:putative protein shisa-6 precursor [Cricetulus griseus]|nr:putative protein shisa-6 precursor [Cricetulus griseus]
MSGYQAASVTFCLHDLQALADILRQQGPIPIAHCERETISAIDTSPKENTPVRSTSKNHYTPVRTAKQTPEAESQVPLYINSRSKVTVTKNCKEDRRRGPGEANEK